jgi:hypothetical protein
MSDDKATDLKSMVRNKRKTIKIAAAGPPQTRSPNPEPPTANTPTKTLAPPNKARFMQEPKDTNNTTATAPSHTLANETTTSSQPTTKYPPQPQTPPSSPTSGILSEIDLRSPSDDPEYDFIEACEATHSARNAQPDRADKYPELASVAAQKGLGDWIAGQVGVKKIWWRGWFS